MPRNPLRFSVSFVRRTFINALTGLLVIFWLLRDLGLRGIECITGVYTTPVRCAGNLWFEVVFWLIVILLILWELGANRQFKDYLRYWKRLWVILPILFISILSSLWSLAPILTLQRSLFLLAASVAVVFIAHQITIEKLLKLLAAFYFIVMIASYLLIFLIPSLGTMQNSPYNGAWSGIFWHRNYLGSFMSFGSLVYLFLLFLGLPKNRRLVVKSLVGFIASVILVVGSRSAAGVLTLVILIIVFALAFTWTRIHKKLKLPHYLIIGSILVGMSVLIVTNLDFIFGLLNRNTSLTGRIPLWNTLFENYIPNRLFLGHGYSVIWAFSDVRLGLQAELGWGYPVMIGDNGLVDILLHLGIVGAALMLLVILYAGYRGIKYPLSNKSLASFFPLIILSFVIVSNITLSMLIELEYFTWALLILAILVTSQNQSGIPGNSG